MLDPATGEPVPWTGSVSVWGPSVLWAPVWATALFVGPLSLEARLHAEPGWRVARY